MIILYQNFRSCTDEELMKGVETVSNMGQDAPMLVGQRVFVFTHLIS